jgi:poly-gamma-glutamate synthesis protein (capsule biosynthesis protein)
LASITRFVLWGVLTALALAGLCLGVLTVSGSQGGPSITVLAMGDVLLDRVPGGRMKTLGAKAVWGPVRSFLKSADLVFVNLEGPVAFHPKRRTDKPANLTFAGDPARVADLAWAGISMVSLANNHINDAGAGGIRDTIQALDASGIAHAGAGLSAAEAHRPAVLKRGGYTLVLLSYSQDFLGAEEAGSGAGLARAEASSLADIAAVKRSLNPDFILVSVHWGNELDPWPTDFQQTFGRACIRAGAVAVLGSHPHVLQGIERYHGGVIAYSLGNASFDMSQPDARRTIALRLVLDHTGLKSIDSIPMVLDSYVGAPRMADPSDAQAILETLKERSAPFVAGP